MFRNIPEVYNIYTYEATASSLFTIPQNYVFIFKGTIPSCNDFLLYPCKEVTFGDK